MRQGGARVHIYTRGSTSGKKSDEKDETREREGERKKKGALWRLVTWLK